MEDIKWKVSKESTQHSFVLTPNLCQSRIANMAAVPFFFSGEALSLIWMTCFRFLSDLISCDVGSWFLHATADVSSRSDGNVTLLFTSSFIVRSLLLTVCAPVIRWRMFLNAGASAWRWHDDPECLPVRQLSVQVEPPSTKQSRSSGMCGRSLDGVGLNLSSSSGSVCCLLNLSSGHKFLFVTN